ncbi:MAG: glycosyltransferase [Actinobacteria bacterium]|nr:glycosyltransferase [Actinomycetota bacterium]
MVDSAPLVSVVVPTRNEAANVGPLWDRMASALRDTAHEVCFVDDSDDTTPDLLAALQATHPDRVRCLIRAGAERDGGLSTAVVRGLRMARGRYVCVMDSDLQHPPETMRAMLAAAQDGADLVVASRYLEGASRRGLAGGGRRAVSSLARVVARLLFSEARRSTDPLSGFFLCRRELIDGIEFRPVGFKILLELLVCVPDLQVRDVPLTFESRSAGESKASMRQGLLFLDHLRSLFLEVEGSARFWKFGLVGLSGLLIFLPALALLSGPARLPPLLAFVPAFAVSLAWNTTLNRVWTFADQRRRAGGYGPSRYLRNAVISGTLMLVGFYLLVIGAHAGVVLAGAISAVGGMLVNGVSNHPSARTRPRLWAEVTRDRGIQRTLARLARELGADRVFMLPPRLPGAGAIPAGIMARAVELGHPALWTEAPSHRHQRRTNIELSSTILIPVIRDSTVLALVICERRSPKPFDLQALEIAIEAGEGLAVSLAAATAQGDGEPAVAAGPASQPG